MRDYSGGLARMFIVQEQARTYAARRFRVLHGGMDFIKLRWSEDNKWMVLDDDIGCVGDAVKS